MALPLGVEVCGLVVVLQVLRVVLDEAVEDEESGSSLWRIRRFFVPSFSRDGEKPEGSVKDVGF